MRPGPEQPAQAAVARLRCRTCETLMLLPGDDPRFPARLLAFFDGHGSGHHPWIDLSEVGAAPLRGQAERG